MDSIIIKIRRLIRFRLRTLLLLPVLFAAVWWCWWWVTWPERTAARFVARLAAGDVEAARAMSDLPIPSETFWRIATNESVKFDRPILASGTLHEHFLGRRRFIIRLKAPSAIRDLGEFVAGAGRVSLSPANAGNLSVTYQLRRLPADAAANILSTSIGTATGERFAADIGNNTVTITMPDREHSQAREILDQLGESASGISEIINGRDFNLSKESMDKIKPEMTNDGASSTPARSSNE